MMLNTKIQVPISQELLVSVKKKSENLGFDSVNHLIRFVLKQFDEGNMSIGISSKIGDEVFPIFSEKEKKEIKRRNKEAGLEYVSDEEQRELEEIIKRNRRLGLNKIAKTKTVRL